MGRGYATSALSALIQSVTATRATTYGRKALTPDRLIIRRRYSAIELLVAQAVSKPPAPPSVYEALGKIFPEIAAAWAEAERTVKIPAHIRKAMELSKLDIAADPDLSPEQRVAMTEAIDATLREHHKLLKDRAGETPRPSNLWRGYRTRELTTTGAPPQPASGSR